MIWLPKLMVKVLFAAQTNTQKSEVLTWVLPLTYAAAAVFVLILLAGAYLMFLALKQRKQKDDHSPLF